MSVLYQDDMIMYRHHSNDEKWYEATFTITNAGDNSCKTFLITLAHKAKTSSLVVLLMITGRHADRAFETDFKVKDLYVALIHETWNTIMNQVSS